MFEVYSGDITKQISFLGGVKNADGTVSTVSGITTGWTVSRCRNGGTPVNYTTPTIVEPDSVNRPGEYWLLLDEDIALADGSLSEQQVLWITNAAISTVRKELLILQPPTVVSFSVGASATTTSIPTGVAVAADSWKGQNIWIVSTGERRQISSNDAAGVITLTATNALSAAPAQNLAGKVF